MVFNQSHFQTVFENTCQKFAKNNVEYYGVWNINMSTPDTLYYRYYAKHHNTYLRESKYDCAFNANDYQTVLGDLLLKNKIYFDKNHSFTKKRILFFNLVNSLPRLIKIYDTYYILYISFYRSFLKYHYIDYHKPFSDRDYSNCVMYCDFSMSSFNHIFTNINKKNGEIIL